VQKSVHENATDCVEIKRGKVFSITLHRLRQTLCRLAPPCPFHLLFPSFSDVPEAPSYSASTVHPSSSQYERALASKPINSFASTAFCLNCPLQRLYLADDRLQHCTYTHCLAEENSKLVTGAGAGLSQPFRLLLCNAVVTAC
jgi:hypothetical protein